MNVSKRYLLLIAAVYIPICIVVATLWYIDNTENQAWEAYLALPLPGEIAHDLCALNLIPSDIADCTVKDTIRQSIMPEIFNANLNSTATYHDVTAIFGEYEFYCDKDSHQNSTEYSCQYRFGSYDVVLIFERDTDRITALIPESMVS
jgi:hypothetical protein